VGDYLREIAGYPHGYHPDTPGDGEVLAEMRAELITHENGTATNPAWLTPKDIADHVAGLKKGIAELEAKIAERRAVRLKITFDEALKQVRQEGGSDK